MVPPFDSPEIRRTETEGKPEGKYPKCPICGKYPEEFFVSRIGNEIVGCERCLRPVEWYQLVDEKV